MCIGTPFQKLWSASAISTLGDGVFLVALPLLAAFGFLLGTGQTLFDNAAQSLIPAIVSRDPRRLERANSQLYGAQTVEPAGRDRRRTSLAVGPPAAARALPAGGVAEPGDDGR